MPKQILTLLATFLLGIIIGFTPAIFFKISFHNDLEIVNQISKEKSDNLTKVIESQKDLIDNMEGLIFFHTSCEAGDKNSCETLVEMLKIYNEPDVIDS